MSNCNFDIKWLRLFPVRYFVLQVMSAVKT